MFSLFVYWKNQQNIEFWVFLSFIIIFLIFFIFLVRELIFEESKKNWDPKKKKGEWLYELTQK